jgi:predicted tellurium resistance membrane protein TerC
MTGIFTIENLVSLVSLTVMEIVLGVDNILFVSIVSGKLPHRVQHKARYIGLSIALAIRIGLLIGISYLVHFTYPLFSISHYSITAHDIIMLGGGLFLMYKSISEINDKLAGEHEKPVKNIPLSFRSAIFQIIILDIVFSFDSILTAIGIAKNVWVMIIAVTISLFLMLAGSGQLSRIFHKYPSIKMLALAFLMMIGFLLVIDGLPDELHVEVPKGYLYFAMAFAFGVEILNIRMRRKSREARQK